MVENRGQSSEYFQNKGGGGRGPVPSDTFVEGKQSVPPQLQHAPVAVALNGDRAFSQIVIFRFHSVPSQRVPEARGGFDQSGFS